MTTISRSIITGLSLLSCSIARGGAASVTLPMPDELHAVPTISRSILSITRSSDLLYMISNDRDVIIKSPFRPNGKTREERFGSYLDATRIPIPKTKLPGIWRAVTIPKNRILIWDGSMLQTALLDGDGKTIIQESSVAADTLRPAADRMGEPTQVEMARTRAAFKKARRSVFGIKYIGMTALPESWLPKGQSYFMIASRIPGFPVLILGCQADDPISCKMERQCFLEDHSSLEARTVRGIGAAPSEKLVLIGDETKNVIRVYKYHSCLNMTHKMDLVIPESLKKISNLHVDADENLWVSTQEWENKYDSNVFYWEKTQWLKNDLVK